MQVARTAYPLNAIEAAKFMLRTRTTLALSASVITATRTPATAICVPSRCSENQGCPSENHRVCLLRSPSLEAADAAVPSQWPLRAPVEERLIYRAIRPSYFPLASGRSVSGCPFS